MWFKIIDQILATEEEREAIYRKLEDHGFIIEERETFDEEENDTFTWRYIKIHWIWELMELNNVLGHPVAIDGLDIDFLEQL